MQTRNGGVGTGSGGEVRLVRRGKGRMVQGKEKGVRKRREKNVTGRTDRKVERRECIHKWMRRKRVWKERVKLY